ncbi:hypothetical protein ACOMHN_011067 [Nucella lapillus]
MHLTDPVVSIDGGSQKTSRLPDHLTFVDKRIDIRLELNTTEELLQALVDKCTDLDLELNVRNIVTDFEDAVVRAQYCVCLQNASCPLVVLLTVWGCL